MSRLANAPLQEVIFEVRWDLERQEGAPLPLDPKFELGLGAFREFLKKDFPEVVRKYPEQIPVQLLPHAASWQFRPKSSGWPLLQLGHGVLTVNDTDLAYDWDTVFFPLVRRALEWLAQAYGESPVFSLAELRYIDSVRLADHGFKDWTSFVGGNLNISVNNEFRPNAKVLDTGLHQVYELGNGGQALVAVNSGKRENEDAMIWQTAVHQAGPFDNNNLLAWAETAHLVSKDLFKEICKPHFYERFTRPRNTNAAAT